ncbi:MAG: tetratricopeptide repeat protein, partial [Thermodesulfovibrionia bacterium]|nr:tetratricopeptide repeat protein [Thermodesulfovibrionia bacterium]
MFEKGVLLGKLAVYIVMAGSLYGCAPQQNNLRKDLPAQEMSGSEIERLGDVYLNQGNLQMALMQYEKFLKQNPENNRVLYKKGLLLLKGKMNEAAIRDFLKVTKKDPEHALGYQGLGQAFFRLKKYEDAIKHL